MENIKKYKIIVKDCDYSSWKILDTASLNLVDLLIYPLRSKLFSEDIFIFNSVSERAVVVDSPIRSNDIAGIIMVRDNKTYGKYKNGKFLYKFIPDNKELPHFLVPYEMKNVGFSKSFVDMYATITFVHWDDKHPLGTIKENIGFVDNTEKYYEYKLHCRKLNISISKMTKQVLNVLHFNPDATQDYADNLEKVRLQYNLLETMDRSKNTGYYIMTIDAKGTADYDDAVSISQVGHGTFMISIYISNVAIWMDFLNLWGVFSKRASTVYIPDKKMCMIPDALTVNYLSLQANKSRIAFVIDVYVNNGNILHVTFNNVVIIVSKNYKYEETQLCDNVNYKLLFKTVKSLQLSHYDSSRVKTSRDVIESLMILANTVSAKIINENSHGVFKTHPIENVKYLKPDIQENNYVSCWNPTVNYFTHSTPFFFKTGSKLYSQITSPIRKVVDLLNIFKLQDDVLLCAFSENAHIFYNEWIDNIDYINSYVKNSRKIQNECSLLRTCVYNENEIHNGLIVEVIKEATSEMEYNIYIVYLQALNLSSKILTKTVCNIGDSHNYKLYIFNDESIIHRKIRIMQV